MSPAIRYYVMDRMLQDTQMEPGTPGRNAILPGTIPLVMTNIFSQGILHVKPLS